MPDQFGRVARDLRVSVTDRCNLRCTYCMPAEGLPWLPKPEMLTDEELLRIVGVFVGLGVAPGPPHRWRAAAAPQRSSTSSRGIAALDAAPPDRDDDQRRRPGPARRARWPRPASTGSTSASTPSTRATSLSLTRRDRLADVERGLKAAASSRASRRSRSTPSRCAGINDDSVADVLAWCLDRGYELRFIEQMPLDAQHAWDREQMVSADEVRARLSERFTLTPLPAGDRGSAPAERFLVDGGPGHRRHHRQRVARRSAPPATGPG